MKAGEYLEPAALPNPDQLPPILASTLHQAMCDQKLFGPSFAQISLVAGAWTERKKIFHCGSFLKLADDNMDIQNPEAQNRELAGF